MVRGLAAGEPRAAPIWTNKLTLSGASSVGTALEALPVYFNAYEPITNTFIDPTVSISASGNINVELTIVDITLVATLPSSVSTSAVPGSLRLNNITSAGGNVAIDLPVAMRLVYTASGTSYVMCVPGSFQLTSSMVNTSGITLSLTDLVKFRMSQSNTTSRVELSRSGIIYYGYQLNTGSGTVYLYAANGSDTYYTLDSATSALVEYTASFDVATLTNWTTTSSESIYMLPNGATLYITNGRVSRLTAYASGGDGADFLAYLYGYDATTNSLLLEDGLARLDLDTGVITLSPDYAGDYLWYLDYDNGWLIGADSTVSSKGTYDIMKLTAGSTTVYEETSVTGQNWFTETVGAYTYRFDFVYPQTSYLTIRPDGVLFNNIAVYFGDSAAHNYVIVTREKDGVTEMVGLYPLVYATSISSTRATFHYLEYDVISSTETVSLPTYNPDDTTHIYRNYIDHHTATQYRYYTIAIPNTNYSLCTTYTFSYTYSITQLQIAPVDTSNFTKGGSPVTGTAVWTNPTTYNSSYALLTANTTGSTDAQVITNIESAVKYVCASNVNYVGSTPYHYYTSSWPEAFQQMGFQYRIDFDASRAPLNAVNYSAIMLGLGSAVSMQYWTEQSTNDEGETVVSTMYGYSLMIGTESNRNSWQELYSATRRIYIGVEYLYTYSGQNYSMEITTSGAGSIYAVTQTAGGSIAARNLTFVRQVYALNNFDYAVIAMNAANGLTSAQIGVNASGEYFISPLVIQNTAIGQNFGSPHVSVVKSTGVL